MKDAAVNRSTWYGPYGMAVAVAIGFGAVTVVTAYLMDLPLRDPDGLFGPSYVRLPLILVSVLALDVVTRALVRTRSLRGLRPAALDVWQERWPWHRLSLALIGLTSFYVTYVAYRNLKSFLPFVRGDLYDMALIRLELWLGGGSPPPDLLHDLLGVGVAAHVLSAVYLFFLFFVPFSLALALVWSNDLAIGSWYVTALCLNWVLGTLSYYLLPAVGPVYATPWWFGDLPETGVSALQEGLATSRSIVLMDPHATERVHGIAAFASLHVSIVFTAALIAHLARLPLVVRTLMWTFFALTALATIYFGWHYLADDVAGVAIGWLSVWLGARGVSRFRASGADRAAATMDVEPRLGVDAGAPRAAAID